MNDIVTDTARALGFLTRFPVPARFFAGDDGRVSRATGAFAIAGLIAALPSAAVLVFAITGGAPPLLAASLALAASVGVTGGLHEDGLADTADGFGARGGKDAILAAMRDSRIGVYGVIALTVSFLIRAAAIAGIAAVSPWAAAVAIIGAGSAGRALMVWHWHRLPPARTDGVAVSAGTPDDGSTSQALISGGLILGACALFAFGIGAVVVSFAAAVFCAAWLTRKSLATIGGHTGDTIGATALVVECAALAALALAA